MAHAIEWRIGCSGFHYPEWKDVFYPPKLPQRRWFEHYATHFNTLELNVSFYKFPRLEGLQKWYKDSPDGFLFSIKAPRLITHYKKFNDAAQQLDDFYNVAGDGLSDKLGAVLFQLPPQVQYSEGMLDLIIRSMRRGFSNVVEFRHVSWWQQPVFDALAAHNISFCGSSHPKLPDAAIVNTAVAYYRFHGVPVLFRSAYEEAALLEKVSAIETSDKTRIAYIYFNNTAGPAALANARTVIDFIGKGAHL